MIKHTDMKLEIEVTQVGQVNQVVSPMPTASLDTNRVRFSRAIIPGLKMILEAEPTNPLYGRDVYSTDNQDSSTGAVNNDWGDVIIESQYMLANDQQYWRVGGDFSRSRYFANNYSAASEANYVPEIESVLEAFKDGVSLGYFHRTDISGTGLGEVVVNKTYASGQKVASYAEGQIPAGATHVKWKLINRDGTQALPTAENMNLRYYDLQATVRMGITEGWTSGIIENVDKFSWQQAAGPGAPTPEYSDATAINAGQYALLAVDSFTRRLGFTIEFLNGSNAVIGSSARIGYDIVGAYTDAANNVQRRLSTPAVLAPANTTQMRIKVEQNATYTYSGDNFNKVVLLKGTQAQVTANTTYEGTLGSSRSNLLVNPSGVSGLNGWAPNTGVTLTSGANGLTMSGVSNATDTNLWVESNMFEVIANGWVQVRGDYTGEYPHARFHWYTATGVHVGYSDYSDYLISSGQTTGSTRFTAKAPATAFQGKLEIHTADPQDTNTTKTVTFKNMVVLAGNTVADVSGVEYDANSVLYQNVINDVVGFGTDRAGLEPGIFQATLKGIQYDPRNNPNIREGNRIIFSAKVGGTWKAFYTGFLATVNVEYPYRSKPLVHISAVDGIRFLANERRADGGATMQGLSTTLTGSTTPYNIVATDGAYVKTHTLGADGSYLDHVVLARDTTGGYAWVDRSGVLQIRTTASITASSVLTFSDVTGAGVQSYSTDVRAGSGGDRIVNLVTVKKLDINGAETTNGPYTDGTSINDWGTYTAEFTIVGSVAPATWATTLLQKTATPQPRIEELAFPIKNATDLANLDKLDLYSPVQVVYSPAGINSTYRISGITMNITPDGWTVTIKFMYLSGSPSTVF